MFEIRKDDIVQRLSLILPKEQTHLMFSNRSPDSSLEFVSLIRRPSCSSGDMKDIASVREKVFGPTLSRSINVAIGSFGSGVDVVILLSS